MKRAALVLLALAVFGVGWQSDLLPRLIALEERVSSLEIVLLTPTPEIFTPTPTPIPVNQTEARNLNSVNVRLRSTPSLTGAILRNIPPQGSVTVCLAPSVQANNLTWLRVSSGGWVASEFLELTENRSYSEECNGND